MARLPGAALLFAVALVACGPDESALESAAGPPGATAERPNVVLIVVDTLRADKLGAYGFGLATSPELDALAAQGVRFEYAMAPSSWTRPSVGSLITGRYPRSLGLYREENEILPPAATTFSEILSDNGYATFGMTANPNLNSIFNFHEGFDEYVDSHVVFSWMKPKGEEQDHTRRPVFSAREVFAAATDFAERNPHVPVYLQLDIMETHEYARPNHALTRREFQRLFPAERNELYLRAVRQASHDIGEFVATITKKPGWEHTLFAIVSDHGEGLDDHPDVANSENHGWLLYESNLHVPLILHHPTWRPARSVVERRVRLIDLMPTLLDFLNLPLPAEMEGVSLLPLFAEPDGDVAIPEFMISETDFQQTGKIAVYGPNWKFIRSSTRHQGVSPLELQAYGQPENGRKTNRRAEFPAVARALWGLIAQWEKRHPRAQPTPIRGDLSPAEREQLESIGYVP